MQYFNIFIFQKLYIFLVLKLILELYYAGLINLNSFMLGVHNRGATRNLSGQGRFLGIGAL